LRAGLALGEGRTRTAAVAGPQTTNQPGREQIEACGAGPPFNLLSGGLHPGDFAGVRAGAGLLTLTCGAEGLILVRFMARFKSGAAPAFALGIGAELVAFFCGQLEQIARSRPPFAGGTPKRFIVLSAGVLILPGAGPITGSAPYALITSPGTIGA